MSHSAIPARPASRRRGKVNVPVLVGGLIVTLGIVAVLGSGFGKDPHRLETDALENKPAPLFNLVDLEGKDVKLSDYIGKQWVVVNFWSTWCGPCKFEHPHLVDAAELYPDVKWVGVVYQDDPKKARVFLAQKRMKDGADKSFLWNADATHLIDPSGAMSVDYGVTGVPETFFINPEGIVVKKYAEPIGANQIMAHLGPPRRMPQ
ncbi:MAG: TlpA family protein disulfide reductase [Alphaproteobacteria bacterium]|nr:TlpA family protein disulfide reductase [Alphaproteobacteria bacterium]